MFKRIVALLLLGMLLMCEGKEERTSAIGTGINGPTDMALLDDYVLILSSNYNQVHQSGSILVVDSVGDKKVASIEVPSMAAKMLVLNKKKKVLVSTFDDGILLFDFTDPFNPVLEHTFDLVLTDYRSFMSPFNMEADDKEERVFVATKVKSSVSAMGSLLYELNVKTLANPVLLGELAMNTEVMHFLPPNSMLVLPTSYDAQNTKRGDFDNMDVTSKAYFSYYVYDLAKLAAGGHQPINKAIYPTGDLSTFVFGNFVSKSMVIASLPSSGLKNSNSNSNSMDLVLGEELDNTNENTNTNTNENNNTNENTTPDESFRWPEDEDSFIAISKGNGTVFLVSNLKEKEAIKFTAIYGFNDTDGDTTAVINPISAVKLNRKSDSNIGIVNWVINGDVTNKVISSAFIQEPGIVNGTKPSSLYGPIEGEGSLQVVTVNNKLYVLNFFENSLSILSENEGVLKLLKAIE